MREFGLLEGADAVFGADAPAHFHHHIVDDAMEFLRAVQECRPVRVHGLGEIVMNVAVSNMAKGAETDPGHYRRERGVRLLDELRRPGNRHRNVVLDARAFAGLGFGNTLPETPERQGPAFVFGEDGVRYSAGFQRAAEDMLDFAPKILIRPG